MKVVFHLNVIHLPQKIRLQLFVSIMKTLSILLILLFPLISLAEIEFIESYKKAIRLAKEQDKLVFMDFTATWCGPCKQLEKTTFAQDSIGDFFNENFINLKVDHKRRQTIFKKYGVKSMPTMLFVDGEGRVFYKLRAREPYPFMHNSRVVLHNYTSLRQAVSEIAAVSDHEAIESLLNKWATVLDQDTAIKCVNEVHDISDTHRAYIQSNYLSLLDEERFAFTKNNIDTSLLDNDEVRDILAYRMYLNKSVPNIKSISSISSTIEAMGFKDVHETKAYLALNHYLYFNFGDKTGFGESWVNAIKYLKSYPHCWDHQLTMAALDLAIDDDEPLDKALFETVRVKAAEHIEGSTNFMLYDLYAFALYVNGNKEDALAAVAEANKFSRSVGVKYVSSLSKYSDKLGE